MSKRLLSAGWEVCSSPPGSIQDPGEPSLDTLQWVPATVPSTAASVLRSAGTWSLDAPARRFDADDWWYRSTFKAAPDEVASATATLGFDGLATIADVWLNGQKILESENMFIAHQCPVAGLLKPSNELLIRFRALDPLLGMKRPRPRWRAPMIENQQLRWYRTTVLGRTPGWSPPAAAVGPWRDIWLSSSGSNVAADCSLQSRLVDGVGTVSFSWPCKDDGVLAATLVVTRGDWSTTCKLGCDADRHFAGAIAIANPTLWWPHTHGEPALYQAFIDIKLKDTESRRVSLGSFGFRTLSLRTEDGEFELSVNGLPIFCRGACWTPLDPVTLRGDLAAYESTLSQVQACGMNMLRIAGTMVYEDEKFFEACDRRGILVWQELMFANMDYPETDEFVASAKQEVRQILQTLRRHPSVAVLCGNSEVEQQAAMWGAPRERWSPSLFHEVLADLASKHCPGVPYWPSSAHGGAFPHDGSAGTTSYYGVGAYLRPMDDARRAGVRFATECLAFANIPEQATIRKMPGGHSIRVHHPAWKSRSPRDLGAGWDFDDVRDHYLGKLFNVVPAELRYADHERYLELGRVATGEVIANTFMEWRRKGSRCHGALVWFLRDLWPGAGWGLIGSDGMPKSAYYYLRRVLQPVAMHFTNEGGNGLFLHVCNDSGAEFAGSMEVTLYGHGEKLIAQSSREIKVTPRSAIELKVADWFDSFHDISYAYRFGPPAIDLVVATWRRDDHAPLTTSFTLPTAQQQTDPGLSAEATPTPEGAYQVVIQTRAFSRAVVIEAEGFLSEDQYFDIPPGGTRTVTLHRAGIPSEKPLLGRLRALNCTLSPPIRILV